MCSSPLLRQALQALEVDLQNLFFENLNKIDKIGTGNTLATDVFAPLLEHCDLHFFIEVRATEATQKQVAKKMAADTVIVLVGKGAAKARAEQALPASCFPLPASCFPLPASRFPLPASCFLLPAVYCLLPTAYFLLPPTAYCLLPMPLR